MRGWGASVAVTVGLLLVSLTCIQRFLKLPGLGAYVLLAGPVLLLLVHYAVPWLAARPRPRGDAVLALLAVVALVAVFRLLYPLANSGKLGPGSDRDDALNIGCAALLRGTYPYTARTYLDAPLTPMPGALLLALPFHLLGNAAYQNVFWLLALGLVLWRAAGALRIALLALGVGLLASPELLKEYVIGGDMGANAIYVLLAIQALLWAAPASRRGVLAGVAAGTVGLALSSRPPYLLLWPLLVVHLGTTCGWRRAAGYGALILAVAAGVTLPFYFHDTAHFSPLHVQNRVRELDAHWPYTSVVVYTLTAAAALAAAAGYGRHRARLIPAPGPSRGAHPAFFACAALVTAVPVLLTAGASALFEPALVARSAFQMSAALRDLSAGHLYVYFLLYAWALHVAQRVAAGQRRPDALPAALRTA
jgi:hypothetical protein